jgi:hypothetical protein
LEFEIVEAVNPVIWPFSWPVPLGLSAKGNEIGVKTRVEPVPAATVKFIAPTGTVVTDWAEAAWKRWAKARTPTASKVARGRERWGIEEVVESITGGLVADVIKRSTVTNDYGECLNSALR